MSQIKLYLNKDEVELIETFLTEAIVTYQEYLDYYRDSNRDMIIKEIHKHKNTCVNLRDYINFTKSIQKEG